MLTLAQNAKEYVAVYPLPPTLVRSVVSGRSTLLCSGIASFRSRGLLDRYLAGLPDSLREEMANLIAGVWLPVSTVNAHFAAAEQLGLSAEEAFAIGVESGTRTQQTVLKTLTRLAAGAGADPWTALGQYGRLWSRVFDGGGVVIRRLGRKEALVTLSELPFARFEYFRHAFRGSNHAGLSPFARTLYVREHPALRSVNGFALRLSWV
jgi:hypothetical protein